MAQVEREVGHVQLARATEDFVHVENVAPAQNAAHMVERELVMAGGHRCVGGEDALWPDGLHILVVEPVAVEPACAFVEQLQSEQRGVTLVHVEAADLVIAEGAQHPHPADAEDDFLAEAVVRVAAVKMMGKRAVPLRVFREVGIQ